MTSVFRMTTLAGILLALVAAAMPSGISTARARQDGDPIKVVATIGMIADIAGIVGGDRVDVTGMMGPGIDPHLYRASESDVSTLLDADVIFYNGLHLEAQLGDVLEQLGARKTTVAVAETIPEEMLLSPEAYEGNFDPHVWFDVSLWKYAVERVRDTFIEYDAANAAGYTERAAAYLTELDLLHAYVAEQAARIPAEQRVLVTAHDAFEYFGRAYGFEVRGLQGVSTATEAGAGDVRELADFIAERRIPAIFVESSVSPQSIEALQAAVRDRGFDVQIGGSLFSDAMGDAGTPEGTYLGMVRHNIDTIVTAFVGPTAIPATPAA